MSDDRFPDHEGITLRGTRFTVSASEKVSTGEYENYSPHLSLEGDIPQEELDEAARADLKEQLLQLHGDLQAVLERAGGNRVAEPEWETWSFQDDDADGDGEETAADGGETDG